MNFPPLDILGLVTLGLGAVVWCLRLEGRVNASQIQITALQESLKAHADTAVQIARLEEQIKALTAQMATQTELIKQLVPKPRSRQTGD